MTLTIVGVVTLLILVLSATFAYFSAPVSNDKKPTNVTATTEAIGSIALSNPTGDLHLNLTVSDMAQDKLGSYWATNDSAKNYDEEEVQREIAVAELSGGAETLKYECTTTISVELSDTMASKLQSEDAYIQFGGLLTEKVDLTNVSSEGYEVTFKLDGTNVKRQAVTAAVAIANRNADQSYIAGTSLGIKFSNSDLSCQVVEVKPKNLSETIMALTEVEDSGVYHETVNGIVKPVVPASVDSWSSMTLGEGVEITSEAKGTYYVQLSPEESSTSIFTPLNEGYYFVNFYNQGGWFSISIYVDNTLVWSCSQNDNDSCATSLELGNLNSTNNIKINIGADSVGSIDLAFNLRLGVYDEIDVGYRYEGTEVNNYVTFNDETWRIIGVEEGSTIGLTSGEYYTKIIKDSYTEEEVYQPGTVTKTISEELKLLTVDAKRYVELDYEFYYNELEWVSIMDLKPIEMPVFEKTYYNQYVIPVGVMSAIDYAYAAPQSECANVSVDSCATKNWLFKGVAEWVISYMNDVPPYYDYVTSSGGLTTVISDSEPLANARPVVYLKSNVIITNDGTGEEGNKFEIGL